MIVFKKNKCSSFIWRKCCLGYWSLFIFKQKIMLSCLLFCELLWLHAFCIISGYKKLKDVSGLLQTTKRLPMLFPCHRTAFLGGCVARLSTSGCCHLHPHTAGGFSCRSSRLILTHLFTEGSCRRCLFWDDRTTLQKCLTFSYKMLAMNLSF